MTDEIPIPSEQIKSFFMNLPFSKYLGLKLERLGNGKAIMTIPYHKNLIGDPNTGILHGGVITTLLDSCCGAAVMTAGNPKTSTATIDLRLDYMRPAEPKSIITAEAMCYRVTNSVIFVRANAHDGTKETPIATATGAFTSPF
ncbi:MAG: PaaI family thioesterase [Paracoccaceae bacterium]